MEQLIGSYYHQYFKVKQQSSMHIEYFTHIIFAPSINIIFFNPINILCGDIPVRSAQVESIGRVDGGPGQQRDGPCLL